MNKFWRSSSAKYRAHIFNDAVCINGSRKSSDIAANFRDYFAHVSVNSVDVKC